jgi:oligopeptide transport system substrate-binding protein
MQVLHSWARPLPFLVLVLVLAGCANPMKPREREGQGGRYYGGVLNANEAEELRSLFPGTLTQASSHRVAAQIYEGLVGFDPQDLSIRPALASSWTVDPTSTVYTLNLRKGVFFHDDACFPEGKGREVTAADVVYCFTRICTADDMNLMSWLFHGRILGAAEHFEATSRRKPSSGVKGIEALDDHTVRLTLIQPSTSFLQVLAHQGCWIYPQELLTHHGREAIWHPVGTGAFRLRAHRRGESLILERNPDYWGTDEHGNRLPFLDAIRYTFTADKDRELDEFLKGNLSMIYELPVERTGILEEAKDRYQVQTIPAYSIQFYGFNARRKPFTDVRVRKAFSLALDRQRLVDSVLYGLAVPATRGVVAPGFAQYPYDSIAELEYDPDRARALLRQAGYPNGQGLPTVFLQVNSDGFGYVKVASMVQSMLESELGVRVVASVLPVKQHFERIERGEAVFWREGWIVDHPDPENILALFHGQSVPRDTAEASHMNSTRYVNESFDGWFALAQGTTDQEKRMRLLANAEKQLMKDMAVLPLYHERSVRLLQPHVRDLPINGMEYRDLRTVWFDPETRATR